MTEVINKWVRFDLLRVQMKRKLIPFKHIKYLVLSKIKVQMACNE